MGAMANRPVAIEMAQRGDARVIATMSRDLIEVGLGWSYPPDRVRRLIADRNSVALVARAGGGIAGFAIMEFGDERAHLVLLAVDPQHRRMGIGRRMMEWLLQSAAVAGVESVHLELRANNREAACFYAAIGFEATLRMPGYYRQREAALRMVRVLRAPGTAVAQWQPPSLRAR
jgi:ribosomal protein S18 acetylase RimI-like enzyme